MPRRNLQLLLIIVLVSLACYKKADSAHRSHYGRMFDTFVEVLRQIDRNYLEEVDERNLFEGAMEGMVGRLDPYSEYIGLRDADDFHQVLDQKFGGIGIEVSWDPQTKQFTVVSPMVDTPAFKAGLLAGDKILSIDGESTENLKRDEAIGRLKGEPGQPVRLVVLHVGQDQPVEMVIERAIIKVPSVLGDARDIQGRWNYMLDPERKLGYLRIVGFGDRTVQEITEALASLQQQGVRGVVLDLRNNVGGLLKAAVESCDLFVRQGRIVSTRGRDRRERDVYDASGNAPFPGVPLVVLVNRHSASASEIVAACLQDHGRAVVVGERTWGKGTVQNVIELEGGKSVLKLTTASYWRPSNQNIHRGTTSTEADEWGVRPNPDLEVRLTDDEMRAVNEDRARRDAIRPSGEALPGGTSPAATVPPRYDPQLDKALDYLRQKLDPEFAKTSDA